MAAAIATRLKFPPFITASSWDSAFKSLWNLVRKARGDHKTADGTLAPQLTNGEVITVIMAYMPPTQGMRQQSFPLWDQYAAAAYGWNPTTGKLNTSAKQRDAFYPDALLVSLWSELMIRVTQDLDDAKISPRLDFDGQWDDVVFQNMVKLTTAQDGSITDTESAHAAFKIPIPACKGPDGKPRAPKCKRVMKRWPYLCEEWEKCEPVMVDDPITKIGSDLGKLAKLALLVGAFYYLFDNRKRRRRRGR